MLIIKGLLQLNASSPNGRDHASLEVRSRSLWIVVDFRNRHCEPEAETEQDFLWLPISTTRVRPKG